MDPIQQIRAEMAEEWLPQIYETRIRPERTRSYEMQIPERENSVLILDTLLGYEIKIGKQRFSCPDLGTARYLCIFATLGCQRIAVPYDITRLPGFADELEASWNKTLELLDLHSKELSPQRRGRIRSKLIRVIRDELTKIGAGELMPLFKTSTRQRES